MKIKEMRKQQAADMQDKLRELRLELAKERAASEIGTVKNPGRIGAIRKDIARILTIQRERELKKTKFTEPLKSNKQSKEEKKTSQQK